MKPQENEWWLCEDLGSVMGLQMVYFYKHGEWWNAANGWDEVKEPFSASKFYEHKLKPLYKMEEAE